MIRVRAEHCRARPRRVLRAGGRPCRRAAQSPAAARPARRPRSHVPTSPSRRPGSDRCRSDDVREVLLRPDGCRADACSAPTAGMGRGLGVEVHLGVPMRVGSCEVEAGGSWSRGPTSRRGSPTTSRRAETVTVTEALQRGDASRAALRLDVPDARPDVVVRPRRRRLDARARRRGRSSSKTACVANVGAGVKYWWRNGHAARVRRMGSRIEGRAQRAVVGPHARRFDACGSRRSFAAESSSDSEQPDHRHVTRHLQDAHDARGRRRDVRLLQPAGARAGGLPRRRAPAVLAEDPAREPAAPRGRRVRPRRRHPRAGVVAPGAAVDKEISFMPARVLLQDFTGVPCVVDLAAMRDGIVAARRRSGAGQSAAAGRARHRSLGAGRSLRPAGRARS